MSSFKIVKKLSTFDDGKYKKYGRYNDFFNAKTRLGNRGIWKRFKNTIFTRNKNSTGYFKL